MLVVIKSLLAKDGTHLLIDADVGFEMPGFLPLQDTSDPDLMTTRAKFVRQVGADEASAPGDNIVRHRFTSQLCRLLSPVAGLHKIRVERRF
jgi:hypothetical protein